VIVRERKFQVKVKLPRPPSAVTSQPSLSSRPKVNMRRTTATEALGFATNTSSSKPQPLRRSGRMTTIVLPKKTYVDLDK